MAAKIDLEKSIKNERLIYKGTFGQLLWINFSSFAGCIGTIAFFYFLLINTFYKHYPFQVASFLILLTIFVSINGYFIDKLYIVKGCNKESNIELSTKILQHYYPKIKN
ncbi:hypothetical protein ACFOW1_06005 [Parasediminibacterium paludis]|uniref:PrgI family protein n=1 Tax=Parasediminibacterium paludis TaxID=908966 RepID=A0ABV8PTJ2_9BACT